MTSDDIQDKHDHWSRLGERGVYAGLYLMLTTYRLFGRAGFSLLLYPVVFYFYAFGRSARRASAEFLTRVKADPHYAGGLGSGPLWRQSFRHFREFGDAILDKLAAWSGRIDDDRISYENRALFDALHREGRGGLLIASHLGNMEVCRALGQLSVGLKLNVLVHTKHAPNFNRLLQGVSADSHMSLIQTTEVGPATAMQLYERVSRGEFVVIVGDRTPVMSTARISWAPFLGRPAPFPQGPYILASLLECPVQLIFCLKRQNRFHIIFEPFTEAVSLSRRNRDMTLDCLVSRYAARLEHYCLSDPTQWFNFFDFWGQSGTIKRDSFRPPNLDG